MRIEEFLTQDWGIYETKIEALVNLYRSRHPSKQDPHISARTNLPKVPM